MQRESGHASELVSEGMRVFGSDGQEVGTVVRVWPESTGDVLPPSQPDVGFSGIRTPTSTAGLGTEGIAGGGLESRPNLMDVAQTTDPVSDVPGDAVMRTAGGGYFQVDRGGFLGIRGDLYVPYSAIGSVEADGVRLNVPAGSVGDQGWGSKPDGLP